ncbi:uncharacterized protein SPAR_D02600 [Saccharomyces paradoxus]|uniref:Uncharacterized protein n=1 Tax=Saccharomyces paradoxus TaxID=27291 RepID=A0A8B8UNF3_SACPA|nr:uncharacterized protein SPAR_D02600 [Saccharomyces paradoxus]QHS72261.1 hypothetical protein SPAR_D02600 [Saccharomyces paradoxus]
MEQILYNQSLKISTLSTFQGLIFLKVLIFSIFQQLLCNPVMQLFETKAPIMESYSTVLFKSSWNKERNFISATKNIFILFFTILRLAEYIVYKLSDQKYRSHTSLNVQHFRWNIKGNTNQKKESSFNKVCLPRTSILPIFVANGLKNRFSGPLPGKSLECFQKADLWKNNNIRRYNVPETKAVNALLWQKQCT